MTLFDLWGMEEENRLTVQDVYKRQLQGLHGGVYRLALMRKKLVHVHCLQFGLSGE